MHAQPRIQREVFCHKTARLCAIIVILIGGAGGLGWILDNEPLKRIHPSLVTMKFNTAIALVLAGAALRLQLKEPVKPIARAIARALGLIIVAIASLTFLEHLSGSDFGIDQCFFRESLAEAGQSFPGRMGVASTLAFACCGIALAWLDGRLFGRYCANWFAGAASVFIALVFLYYFYGVEQFEAIALYATIALHTAVAFFGLCLGILFARPTRGVMLTFLGDGPGSVVARRMLLPAVVLPLVVGYLRILGQNAGLYGVGFGRAIYALAIILIFTVLIWWTGRSLDQLDQSRRDKELALEQSEQKFSLLFQKAPFAVALSRIDDGAFVDINEAFERMYGFPKHEVVGKTSSQLGMNVDEAGRAQIRQQLQQGQPVHNRELRLRSKSGRDYSVLANIDVVSIAGEKFILATTQDITERKKAEEALQHAQAELQQHAANLEHTVAERTLELKETNEQLEAFVYSIAHDLRAPLRAMQGFSEMLIQDEPAIAPQSKTFLTKIYYSAEYMDKMILDLLAFGRTARSEVELARVDIQPVWDAAVYQCSAQIEQTGAVLEAIGPFPAVRAHEPILTQVLANLLNNAMKFVETGTTPRVRFRCEDTGHSVRLWVEDNGVGIDGKYHERIFRVFERLHGHKYSGTGIGLSIVRKGVERMNGNLGLESQVGKGTRFWVELPKA